MAMVSAFALDVGIQIVNALAFGESICCKPGIVYPINHDTR